MQLHMCSIVTCTCVLPDASWHCQFAGLTACSLFWPCLYLALAQQWCGLRCCSCQCHTVIRHSSPES